MLREHALARSDPYSFTSDIPWINHEWLAEAVMALAYAAGGGPGLVVLKMAMIALALGCIYAATKHVLVGSTRDLVLFASAIGLWARVFVVRPQLFSIALFAALLWVLVSAERGRHRRLWLLPPIFAVWVNLHGGWIVGLGALGLWCGVALSRWRPRAIAAPVLAIPIALTLLATLLNPYGSEMWSFLAATVRIDRHALTRSWRNFLRYHRHMANRQMSSKPLPSSFHSAASASFDRSHRRPRNACGCG